MQRKDYKLFNLILILLTAVIITKHLPQFLQHPGADNEQI